MTLNRGDLPKPNATCQVCGRQYRICNTCSKMKRAGIESWRTKCDSVECYQTLIFTEQPISECTIEQLEYVKSMELPEDRKPIKEIQDKLDAIEAELKKPVAEKYMDEVKNDVVHEDINNIQSNKKDYFSQKKGSGDNYYGKYYGRTDRAGNKKHSKK